VNLEIIITAANGRSTIYTRGQLRRDVQAMARRFRETNKGAKVVASHVSVAPSGAVQLVAQMRRADGWNENISEAL
jgi:hypothetical protein